MKLAGVLAIVCALEAGALGLVAHQAGLRRQAARDAADSLVAARAESRRLDSLLAASRAADSAARVAATAEIARRITATDAKGRLVLSQEDSLAALARVFAELDSAEANELIVQLQDTTQALLAAVALERAARDSAAAADSTALAHAWNTLIPDLQRQRDTAQDRAEQSLARAVAAERGWAPWRRVIAAVSCASAGAGLILTAKTPTAAGGIATTAAAGVCGLSLALP